MKGLDYLLFILLYYIVRAFCVFPGYFHFSISFLDVGQGDSLVINVPNYGRIVVDTGSNYQSNYLVAKGDLLPICQLKLIIITHYDSDHKGGLSRYIDYCPNIKVYDNLSRGDVVNFGTSLLYILSPETKETSHEENDDSIVALLRNRNDSLNVLLAGDAGLKVLERISKLEFDRMDVYKVSHHGSIHNNSSELVEKTKPKICIISVGKNNFGHPSPQVLKDLTSGGCKVFRTDLDGTIVVY